MTKKDIALRIAKRMNLQQTDVRRVVQMVLDSITEVLVTEGRLELQDFGVYKVKVRKPRKARNPKTGEAVMVPLRKAVMFRAGQYMEDRVNGIVGPANFNAVRDEADLFASGDFVFEHDLDDWLHDAPTPVPHPDLPPSPRENREELKHDEERHGAENCEANEYAPDRCEADRPDGVGQHPGSAGDGGAAGTLELRGV